MSRSFAKESLSAVVIDFPFRLPARLTPDKKKGRPEHPVDLL
jgi:hypothetical protein